MLRWLERKLGLAHPCTQAEQAALSEFLATAQRTGMGKQSAELRRISRRKLRRQKANARNTTIITGGKYRS